MTEETKPRYELKRRSMSYVLLYEGDHCLCAICTKTPRGTLDAELLLLVMNSHEDLLRGCEATINIIGIEDIRTAKTKCKAAMEKAKPK